MSNKAGSTARPEDVNRDLASRAVRRISEYLSAHPDGDPIHLQGELAGDDALVVPRQAIVMFAQILDYLANNQIVQIVPSSAMFTTQQAADFLNVSRPYLIKLLETNKIPFEKVGTHRRISFTALMEYKRQDDQHRRAVVDELAQLGQELEQG